MDDIWSGFEILIMRPVVCLLGSTFRGRSPNAIFATIYTMLQASRLVRRHITHSQCSTPGLKRSAEMSTFEYESPRGVATKTEFRSQTKTEFVMR